MLALKIQIQQTKGPRPWILNSQPPKVALLLWRDPRPWAPLLRMNRLHIHILLPSSISKNICNDINCPKWLSPRYVTLTSQVQVILRERDSKRETWLSTTAAPPVQTAGASPRHSVFLSSQKAITCLQEDAAGSSKTQKNTLRPKRTKPKHGVLPLTLQGPPQWSQAMRDMAINHSSSCSTAGNVAKRHKSRWYLHARK